MAESCFHNDAGPCPTCDVCGRSQCQTEGLDWNGVTGNHIACEAPLISITFTAADVRDIALDAGVDPNLAIDRALEWASVLTDHATGTLNDQLASVVVTGQV